MRNLFQCAMCNVQCAIRNAKCVMCNYCLESDFILSFVQVISSKFKVQRLMCALSVELYVRSDFKTLRL